MIHSDPPAFRFPSHLRGIADFRATHLGWAGASDLAHPPSV